MNRILCLWQQRLGCLEQDLHSFSDSCEIWNDDTCKSGPPFCWNNSSFGSPHLLFWFFPKSCLLVCEMLNFFISIIATLINWFVAELLHQKKKKELPNHFSSNLFSLKQNPRDWFYVMWNIVWAVTNIFGSQMDAHSKSHQEFRYTKMLKER